MKTFPRFILSSLMAVILIGCGTATQVSDPTVIPFPFSTDLTITQAVTRSPTAVPSPSSTIDLTQTVMNQDYLTGQATERTLVATYPRACNTLYAPREFSPNGLWLVELCYSENDQDLILTVSKRDSQIFWKLTYRDYIPTRDLVVDGGISVVHWSNDEKYAYFRSYLATSGGYCFVRGNFDESGLGLFRLDLQTGEVATTLPLKENYGWYGFAFSPTNSRLVYGAYARDFQILDISTGQLTNVASVNDYHEGGGLIWSPDGLKLVYSTVLNNEVSEPVAYTLRLVDAQSGDERILIKSSRNCFVARTWTDGNILIIDSYAENGDSTIVEYDLNTSNIRESTATP